MFRRQNLKWTVPLLGVVVVCAVVGVYLAGGGEVQAQTPPPALTVQEIISAMQDRADDVGSLTALLGEQMILPEEGTWRGTPMKFRESDDYVQLTGTVTYDPEEQPTQEENAWKSFADGALYVRHDGVTRRAEPGETAPVPSLGNGPDTLLVVNLMPAAWFAPFAEDLEAGDIEEVDSTYYYTLLDVEQLAPRGHRLYRFPEFRKDVARRPRKYYVDSSTFVCSRLVFGPVPEQVNVEVPEETPMSQPDPFLGGTADVVASDVETVAGGPLPLTYTKRYFGDGGAYHTVELTLEDVESVSPGSFADADFDPRELSPGAKPLVLDTTGDLEAGIALTKQSPGEPGAWLSLAEKYAIIKGHPYQGIAALEEADDVAGSPASPDYAGVRQALWERLEYQKVEKEVVEAPQMESIFERRAARFQALGDSQRAADMTARAEEWEDVKDAAVTRAKELEINVPAGL